MRSIHRWSLLLISLCVPAFAEAGWPFTAEGPRRGSAEWYEMHACSPVGQRQRIKFGKVWPAAPRPMGEPAPLVHKLHHNCSWPSPYDELDKASVFELANIQVMNGWQDATTFYEYHFESDAQVLNRSGREHLHYLLSRVPMEFRTAYVQASLADPELNDLRMANLQSEAARLVGVEQAPPVLLRITTPHGTPAGELDSIFEYRRTNLSPPPILSVGGGTSGGAGGG